MRINYNRIDSQIRLFIQNNSKQGQQNKKTIIIQPIRNITYKNQSNNMLKSILLYLCAAITSMCFEFKAAKISCLYYTAGAQDQYTIQLQRAFASDLSNTAWNTQAVPAGANVTVYFPSEITLFGNQSCSSVFVNGAAVTGFSFQISTTAKTIIITNAIPTTQFINGVIVVITKVKNPSLTLTTSSFVGRIGIDVSSNDSSATVSFNPGAFTSITAKFDPTTVNTTGSLVIHATVANPIPITGSLIVYFPADLTWLREIHTTTHKLPISTTMSCSAISSNIKVSLTCTGDPTQATVTITNAFQTSIAENSMISFSINNLFSPPTTSQINSITLQSLSSPYTIDQAQITITGLTAKPFNLTISSDSAFTINTGLNLKFSFVLPDTVSRADAFVITFPSGSIFNYVTFVTTPTVSFNGSSISYNNSTRQLRMVEVSSAPIRPAGTSITITLLTYTTPGSAKLTGPFYLTITNSDGTKYQGFNSIMVLPKSYTSTLSTTNTTINSLTSYSIAFNMADAITSSGYFLIKFPTELPPPGSIGIQIQSNSINSNPAISFVNSTFIKLSNLNTSNTNIPAQNLIIKINDLVQYGAVRNISSFTVYIYYSSADDIVAQTTNSNSVATTPGLITTAAVTSTSYTNAQVGQYSFSFTTSNNLSTGSSVLITVPSAVIIVSGGVCKLQSTTIACTTTSTTINMTLPSASSYVKGTQFILSYSTIKNPSSTKPTDTFMFNTYNSLRELVDVTGGSITIAMTTPNSLTSVSLIRGSNQNSFITSYTFIFIQSQAIKQTSGSVAVTLPSQITPQSSITCSTGSTTLSCSLSSSTNTITISFTPIQLDSTTYNFTINGLQNPYSLKPTQSIVVSTASSDGLYKYSTASTGLEVVNTIPAGFKALAYQFTNQALSQDTNLIINITLDAYGISPAYLSLQLAPSFAVTSSSSLTCTTSSFTPICTIILNSTSASYYLKVQSTSTIPLNSLISLTISILKAPSTIPSDFTFISSYTADNYLISENKNTIKFTTFCNFPCRLCDSTNRSSCLACYTVNVTNSIYLFQNQCLSECPAGYIANNGTISTCIACVAPCLTCLTLTNYCTTCNTSTQFKYLNRTSTTSTCLAQCPLFMYADLTQIPQICVDCVSPCKTCTTRTSCSSCVDNFYLYQTSCLTSCPTNITVLINTTCVKCQTICATCSVVPQNCTSCTSPTSLYNNTCVSTCPGNLISVSNICLSCDPKCLTCSISITNCTSCYVNGTQPFYYQHSCLNVCPNFFYPDTFKKCLSCDLLNRGCKNCSSPSVCLSCDPGFVLLNSNCLSTVPDGYLNISGIAVPCQGDCETCSVVLTNCTSCKTLNLFENTCKDVCPAGTVALNRVCRTCTYPCSQCINSTTKCTKCASNSSLYLYNNSCVASSLCPAQTYPENATLVCTNCTQPCNLCKSPTICTTCINGYFFVNDTSLCQTSCPNFSVGINRICMACISPCESCVNQTTKCLTCVADYFYNSLKFECLTTCPSGQIANQTTMQCDFCLSPCKTCINTTDTCLSCVLGTFLSGSLCVKVCPDGQFGASGLCKNCQNNCSTCSSAVTCLSCQSPLVLYSAKCLQNCPVSHSIVSNDSVCISCQTVVAGCSNCSINGQCFACYFPKIFYQSVCVDSCPQGYKFENSTCLVNNITDNVLKQSLESFTFPIPFTILGCVLLLACCMSKLQNSNTYLVGLLYSLLGIVQTGCLAHLIYQYIILGPNIYVKNNLYIILAVAAIIYIINALALIIQTPFLVKYDSRFAHWLKSDNQCFFAGVTIFSALINYKFKMILFSKLFKFHSMSAFLQNLYRFRLFNIFSFFGILPEALGLYVCFIQIVGYKFEKLIFHAFLDVIIIFIINILLAILIVWKPDNFFHEDTQQGYAINKKMTAGGDDFSKQAILCDEINNQTSYHGPNQYSILAVSPVKNARQQSDPQQSSRYKNFKVYFANGKNQFDQSSNPFRKSKKLDRKQKIDESNIFTGNQDERYSQNAVQNFGEYQDQSIGGSEQIPSNLSPRSPKKHATIVVGGNDDRIKTNHATQNDDIGKKISLRQKQLDEIKKQLEQQESVRKQKRKSRKKLKKSIQYNLDVPQKQTPYQQISIHQGSQKFKTEQDSNMRTMQEPKGVQLNQQNKQVNIEQDFKDIPKQTINSWMQLKITEQNRKLPVFNKNFDVDMQTMSLPESQAQNQQQQQLSEKQDNKEKLPEEQNMANVLDDIKQLRQQKAKAQNEKLAKKNKYEFQQSSKDHSSHQIFNNSIEQIQKKIGSNNISNDVTKQNVQSHRTNNKNSFSYYDEKNNIQMNESSKSNVLQQESKFSFEQQSKDYDQRAGTRLNFQNMKDKVVSNQLDQLQDSQRDDKQKINQRPFSAAKKNRLKNTQALLEILAKSQRQRMNSKGSNGRRVSQQQQDQPRTSFEGKKFKISRIKKSQIQQQDQQQNKSKIYQAGLYQLNKQSQNQLNKKKTMNYPLKSIKKKSIQDNQGVNQIRNSKSFNSGPGLRKFTSKDMSSDYLDELDLRYEDYHKNYQQLMNQRSNALGSNRKSRIVQGKSQTIYRRSNFIRGASQDIVGGGKDQSLNQYYKKQQKSIDKRQKKSLTKQKSLQQTKRIKELQRIYLARN